MEMFSVNRILDKDDFNSSELSVFLDERFKPELSLSYMAPNQIKKIPKDLEEWGERFRFYLPRNKVDRFYYICQNSDGYWIFHSIRPLIPEQFGHLFQNNPAT
ncbi:MAG: hypothetical protein K9L30_17995 [Desulfobacterales bacterium]|nr:hypothetical protein [Desulfobacterales bacterium]